MGDNNACVLRNSLRASRQKLRFYEAEASPLWVGFANAATCLVGLVATGLSGLP